MTILLKKRAKIAKRTEKEPIGTKENRWELKKNETVPKGNRKRTTKSLHQCHFKKKWRAWVEFGCKNQKKEIKMNISQFYMDQLAVKKVTFKFLKNKILQDFDELGDLTFVAYKSPNNKDKYKNLGYLLKNNSKFVTQIRVYIIAARLYMLTKVQKNAHGS